jgi:hypothetical protein
VRFLLLSTDLSNRKFVFLQSCWNKLFDSLILISFYY